MIAAVPLVRRAILDLKTGKCLSLFPFLAGTCLIAVFINVFAALEIIWITLASLLLEDYVADRSQRAIRETLQIASKSACILVDGVGKTVPADLKAVLDWLRKDGVHEMYMITGDMEVLARDLSKQYGFNNYAAGLKPEEKADYVADLEASGQSVVTVGDGVNDALAMSNSTIGIAMKAGGAEVVIEAADIALFDNNLERLVILRQLSCRTLRSIEQNY